MSKIIICNNYLTSLYLVKEAKATEIRLVSNKPNISIQICKKQNDSMEVRRLLVVVDIS